MAGSLRDQLKKSGLVSAHDARRAASEKHKSKRKQRAGHADEDAARRAELARAQSEKVERDRALNAERQAEADARAVQAQVLQLVGMNRIERGADADQGFNYTDGTAVRSLHVTPAQHAALAAGQLAIVRGESGAELVPAGAARKIRERDSDRVLVLNERGADDDGVDEDDPYAGFEVPDDLMW